MQSNQQENRTFGAIRGISIGAFLQLLEQEKNSCQVIVQSEKRIGILFFLLGELIDAEYMDISGIEAAYNIVSWEDASIGLDDQVDRMQKIDQPLGFILLNAAKKQDEKEDTPAPPPQPKLTYMSPGAETNPDLTRITDIINTITAIEYYYIINKSGEIIVHSAPDSELGELMIFCIVTGSNMRTSLQAKGPKRIHLTMKNSSSLLILPGTDKIIGMLLKEGSSAHDVAARIRPALSAKLKQME